MNYKPKYKTIGPRKEIMVSLPQITDEMKLKHKYMYSEGENLENFIVDDDDMEEDKDDISVNFNIKEDSDLNRKDAVLNENIQVHTFDSNQRFRYDMFFDNSDTEDNTTPSKKETVDDAEFQPNSAENDTGSESEFIDVDSSSDYTPHIISEEKSPVEKKNKRKADRILYSTKHIDDGDEFYYQVNRLPFKLFV